MNNKKICFITCVNDEECYNECLKYINNLVIPDGLEIEILEIKDVTSIASGYNEAMRASDAKYKVYLHQDVFIINRNFIPDIINIFANNKDIGMLGVAGAKLLPKSAIWWDAQNLYGKIYDSHTDKMEYYIFGESDEETENVNAIDGLIMITQYDVSWRDDLFDGWHFYDISQSIEFILAQYNVAVVNQRDPWCIHDCGISNISNGYDKCRKIFLNEYSSYLL